MKRVLFCIILTVFFGQLTTIADTNLVSRNALEKILLMEDYPDKTGLIVDYAKRSGVGLQEIAKEMEIIITNNIGSVEPATRSHFICSCAIYSLGELGNSSSLPTLRKAALSKDQNLRIAAIQSYVKIARENSLDYAKEIVAKPDQFGMMERFILYEHLAGYAQKTDDPLLDAKRKAVRQFLVDNMQKETNPDAAKELDELLCGISPAYKVSLQRESAATRFKDEKVPIFRDYFNGVLNELGKVPKGDRTDLTNN